MSSSAPVPSKVYFITQLRRLSTGDKVRFIGCVNHYNEKTATLDLFHKFPNAKSAAKSTVHLDITDLLESIKRDDIEIGAWINAIGYIQPSPRPSAGTDRDGYRDIRKVKAVMLWSAGSINIDDYEKALTERQAL